MTQQCLNSIKAARRACVEQLFNLHTSVNRSKATARANVNIALVKYWGKRETILNLPVTSSLSVELPGKGTCTSVLVDDSLASDQVLLDDEEIGQFSSIYRRIVDHIDLFRQQGDQFRVESYNSIPTAAGLASSASGFAALTAAMIEVYDLERNDTKASIVARLGSGSACRSIFSGFVRWNAGQREDGLDSYAVKLDSSWPELRVGLVMVKSSPKPLGSTEGMLLTQQTALQYKVWPEQVARDMELINRAIDELDFSVLGSISESNALCMHASMLCSQPSLLYWQPETVELMHRVWSMRKRGHRSVLYYGCWPEP